MQTVLSIHTIQGVWWRQPGDKLDTSLLNRECQEATHGGPMGTVTLTCPHVVIVGDYGPHWRSLPIVAHTAEGTLIFCDHRNGPRQRSKVIAPLVIDDEASFEVLVVSPPSGGCEEGFHAWVAVTHGELMVAARCQHCGTVEAIDPMPMPKVNRRLAEAG